MSRGRSLVVVSYDIVSDKRRRKVHDVLQDFGPRVQYSVFECRVTSKAFERLIRRIKPLTEPEADTVRIYQICESDVRWITLLGGGEVTRVDPYRMV